jgi:hypothetical protein
MRLGLETVAMKVDYIYERLLSQQILIYVERAWVVTQPMSNNTMSFKIIRYLQYCSVK